MALLAVCLVAVSGNWFWQGFLVSNFRPHLAILSLPLAAIAWRFGKIALLLAFFCLASTAYPVAIAVMAKANTQATSNQPILKIATFNLRFDNADEKSLLAEIERLDVDLLFLSEVEPARRALIAALGQRYPYRAFNGSNPGAPGEALFSRLPLSDESRLEVSPTAPFWQVTVLWQDTSIDIFAGHPPPALGARLDAKHAAWFQAAEEALRQRSADRPLLILGDLNATPWSSRLAQLIQDGDLRWAYAGGTWPSTFPHWLALPIDHILLSDHLALKSAALGFPAGSDHRPLLVEVTFAPSSR